MHATAAIFHAPGQPLELVSVALPRLTEGEALVEIDCCTLCGSDLHSIAGTRRIPTPSVLGHEILGRIVETSGDVIDVNGNIANIGERIVWSVAASCGSCFYCTEGPPQKCESLFKYGHEEINPQHPLSGGLATHCHLTAGTAIIKVPDGLSDFVACPASCATATVAAALRTAGRCESRTVVIHGAGMLGLTAAAMSCSLGAANVIVTDVDRCRAQRARQFGGTHASIDSIADITQGRGADIVLDMSGSPDAMESSLDQLRIGGRLILVGAVFPARPLSLQADHLVRRMIRIEGVHNYEPQDLQMAVQFLSEFGECYPFASLVDRAFPLQSVNDAVAWARESRPFRVAVRPQPVVGSA